LPNKSVPCGIPLWRHLIFKDKVQACTKAKWGFELRWWTPCTGNDHEVQGSFRITLSPPPQPV
jgi:hypothetical protein